MIYKLDKWRIHKPLEKIMATKQALKTKKTVTKKAVNKKTIASNMKILTSYIIDKVMDNDKALNSAREEVDGIQDRLFQLILNMGGGSLSSINQLQAIKVQVYDQVIYPDSDGNLCAFGREKMSPQDTNVSAKAEGRMQASPTVKKVFSECAVALRSIQTNKKGISTFGCGFEKDGVNLGKFQTFNDSDFGEKKGLKSAIKKAKEETTHDWFTQYNRVSEVLKLEKDSMKVIIRENDYPRLETYLDAKVKLMDQLLDSPTS
jgi:hypothetical protein